MSKMRVYEVAKQLSLEPKALVTVLQTLGVPDIKNHMSSVDDDVMPRLKSHLGLSAPVEVEAEPVRAVVRRRAAPAKVVADGEPASAPATSAAPAVPAAPASATALPSTRELPAEAPSVKALPSTRELPAEAPSVKELPVVEAAPVTVRATEEQLSALRAHAAAEVATPEPAPAPAPVSEPAHTEPPPPPPVATQAAPEPTTIAPTTARPKTGVEYWTGRPGVPMPVPPNASRTGIGGGLSGGMARRVQYDPRGSARPAGRPGAPQSARPFGQNARGPNGRPFGGKQVGGSRRPGVSSTQEMSSHKKVIRIEENITLQTMAQKMSMKATELLMRLLGMGMTGVHINTSLDADTAKILASEFGWEVEDVATSEEDNIAAARGDESEDAGDTSDLPVRAPVVTVMGHVDHGKTSLLDRIRKANVAGGEAGGITQHIGAYKVQTDKGEMVFLDTPGHEAFTQMRARGAGVTDVVILVVAADDGVMPQTKEAAAHAKAAGVPIIVAVNKIDKPGAEPERVRRELVEIGLQPEEWGGDTQFVHVSAKSGEGIPELLDAVMLQAEVLDLRANPDRTASGTVLEALLDRGRGPVARVLVQDGTLKVGDFVLAGPGFGKVRAMTNEHGKAVHSAGPSTPVEILGLSDVPGAGDPVDAVKDPKKALEIAEARKGKLSKSMIPASARVSLEELSKRMSSDGQQELRVILKGDVQGSVEAVAETLTKLSGEKVRLLVVHAGVGAVTEGDVNLAIAARALIIGFNVKPAGKASSLAEENKIEIRHYSIIYQAVDDVKSAMEGLLPSLYVEKVNGRAEVRVVYTIRNMAVGGCYVTEKVVKRAGSVRVIRGNEVIHTGKISQLKRFKDDVKEVTEGFECGISIDSFQDLKELDIIESFELEEVKQKL